MIEQAPYHLDNIHWFPPCVPCMPYSRVFGLALMVAVLSFAAGRIFQWQLNMLRQRPSPKVLEGTGGKP